MDRETKTIITPIEKHKVVLYSWITGAEKRKIKSVFLKNINMEYSPTGEKGKVQLDSIVNEAEDLAIDLIVVSVDGKTENKKEAILAMRAEDYDFVVEEINKITGETEFNKKKES